MKPKGLDKTHCMTTVASVNREIWWSGTQNRFRTGAQVHAWLTFDKGSVSGRVLFSKWGWHSHTSSAAKEYGTAAHTLVIVNSEGSQNSVSDASCRLVGNKFFWKCLQT